MLVKELIAVLKMLPKEAQAPIVRGRHEPEIFVSIPEASPIPKNWSKAAALEGYYPEGTKRIRYTGGT